MSAAVTFGLFSVFLIAGTVFYLFFYRSWRRNRELQEPFPASWQRELAARVPLYRALDAGRRRDLEQRVQLFLAEKTFYGCDGFTVNDAVKITIAGHACLLILARAYSDFDDIRSILVYPDAYHATGTESDGYVVSETSEIRAGEASTHGQVVLAWTECEEAASNPDSPHNVILHEFAHQLDYLDGSADGAPPLSGEQARRWQNTMTDAYEHLLNTLEHHDQPWLDPYGASEPAEFFAVLTEAFFQTPDSLKASQPAVFGALKDYYRLDPTSFGQQT